VLFRSPEFLEAGLQAAGSTRRCTAPLRSTDAESGSTTSVVPGQSESASCSDEPGLLGAPDEHATVEGFSGKANQVMLKNILNWFTRKDLMALLDEAGLRRMYNGVYLPIGRTRKGKSSNLGYAFVDFKQASYVEAGCQLLNGRQLGAAANQKRIEVVPAHALHPSNKFQKCAKKLYWQVSTSGGQRDQDQFALQHPRSTPRQNLPPPPPLPSAGSVACGPLSLGQDTHLVSMWAAAAYPPSAYPGSFLGPQGAMQLRTPFRQPEYIQGGARGGGGAHGDRVASGLGMGFKGAGVDKGEGMGFEGPNLEKNRGKGDPRHVDRPMSLNVFGEVHRTPLLFSV